MAIIRETRVLKTGEVFFRALRPRGLLTFAWAFGREVESYVIFLVDMALDIDKGKDRRKHFLLFTVVSDNWSTIVSTYSCNKVDWEIAISKSLFNIEIGDIGC